jgi:hypothetical protein
MEHSADIDWLIRENLDLHRQLRITMAFLGKVLSLQRRGKRHHSAHRTRVAGHFRHATRSPPPQRQTRRGSHFRCATIRVYDSTGAVIQTHEHAGDFREP